MFEPKNVHIKYRYNIINDVVDILKEVKSPMTAHQLCDFLRKNGKADLSSLELSMFIKWYGRGRILKKNFVGYSYPRVPKRVYHYYIKGQKFPEVKKIKETWLHKTMREEADLIYNWYKEDPINR